MARRWHILRDEGELTLARSLPVRFDVWSETDLPVADPVRLAHQIRQDMWRALQSLRGFSPIVQVTQASEHRVTVRAGGRVDGAIPANVSGQIASLLNDADKRARWVAHARRSSRRTVSC